MARKKDRHHFCLMAVYLLSTLPVPQVILDEEYDHIAWVSRSRRLEAQQDHPDDTTI
jgi:hypothetical protein